MPRAEPLQLKAAACQTFAGTIPGKPWRPIARTSNNESTEVQTLGAIRIQLYHQCFEQVWQHNFTSIIGLRRSTQRHRSSKVNTSIIDLRRSTHRSSKIEGANIAPTTQHRADIPTIRHRILSTTALHNYYT